MKILNLFAGIGGNRSLWGTRHQITAVEFNPSIMEIYHIRFPKDHFEICDAYEFVEQHYEEYDFIWASPPCPTHSKNMCRPAMTKKIPDMRLYGLIIFLQRFYHGKWIVENVIPYYEALIKPTVQIDRHNYWSNCALQPKLFEKRIKPQTYIGKDGKKHNGGLSDLSLEQLSKLHNIPLSLFDGLHIDKRNVLRNCMNAEIGAYLLNQIQN